jgi:hypothetical protein
MDIIIEVSVVVERFIIGLQLLVRQITTLGILTTVLQKTQEPQMIAHMVSDARE